MHAQGAGLAAEVATGAAAELFAKDTADNEAVPAAKAPVSEAVFASDAVRTACKEHSCWVACAEGYG